MIYFYLIVKVHMSPPRREANRKKFTLTKKSVKGHVYDFLKIFSAPPRSICGNSNAPSRHHPKLPHSTADQNTGAEGSP